MREERCEQELKKKRNDIGLTPRSLFELIKVCQLTRIHTYKKKQNKKKCAAGGTFNTYNV